MKNKTPEKVKTENLCEILLGKKQKSFNTKKTNKKESSIRDIRKIYKKVLFRKI